MSQRRVYRCHWCLRETYHPEDVTHRFCSCCGDDGPSKRECEHRKPFDLTELWDQGVRLVRRDPWAPGNYLELLPVAGGTNYFSIYALVHSPLEWEGVPLDIAMQPQPVSLYNLPLGGWEAYTGLTVEQGKVSLE